MKTIHVLKQDGHNKYYNQNNVWKRVITLFRELRPKYLTLQLLYSAWNFNVPVAIRKRLKKASLVYI